MRQAVIAVILRDGKLLAIQRGPAVPYAGHWAPPSGRIEPGETQPQAVVREMAEELGLEVEPIAKVWECPTDDGRYVLHWWTARPGGNELRLEPGEVSAARWVTPEEFLALEPTFEGDREFVANVLPKLKG
ncbi:MAG TPA: NUDIX domain-containing protein [Myxococcota bacterium]|nr:NUDIX domain-containing protein [Myxococcota bacterium]